MSNCWLHPQASGWYREVLNAVPAVYAGSAARLAAIVRLVRAELVTARHSLSEQFCWSMSHVLQMVHLLSLL